MKTITASAMLQLAKLARIELDNQAAAAKAEEERKLKELVQAATEKAAAKFDSVYLDVQQAIQAAAENGEERTTYHIGYERHTYTATFTDVNGTQTVNWNLVLQQPTLAAEEEQALADMIKTALTDNGFYVFLAADHMRTEVINKALKVEHMTVSYKISWSLI